MYSDNRHRLSRAEIFLAREEQSAIQHQRTWLRRSTRPDQHQRLQHRTVPSKKLTHCPTFAPPDSVLAWDLISEQIQVHGLVNSALSHRRHSIADSHHFSVTNRMAGIWLLRRGRYSGCGRKGIIYSVVVLVCYIA